MPKQNLVFKKETLQVEGTNDSSCLSKLSCSHQGYFCDEYLKYFVKKKVRRSPLIHIGYCVRFTIIYYIVCEFIHKMKYRLQIVSLGAGFDTLFFRLVDRFNKSDRFAFYELDLPRVVDTKIKCIISSKTIVDLLGTFKDLPGVLSSKQYCLLAADLRHPQECEKLLIQHGVDFSLPTLFLSECAITYLEENSSNDLIKWASSTFPQSTFVTYEQIHPSDGFGIVMLNHFKTIGSPLQSVKKYPTLEDQNSRYLNNGWTRCQSGNAFDTYIGLVTREGLQRIVQLEQFDEWEEFHLKCVHYTLTIASQGDLEDWALLRLDIPVVDYTEKRKCIDWNLVEVKDVNIYSHVAVRHYNDNVLLITGGFSSYGKETHGRSRNVFCVKEVVGENDKKFTFEKVDNAVNFEALHSTWTEISSSEDGTTYIMYGGRLSPRQYVNACPILVNVSRSYLVNLECPMDTYGAQPRYRHSAVILKQGGVDIVVIFGGRTNSQRGILVLNDLWKVILPKDKEKAEMCIIENCSKWPCERFSHSAESVDVDSEYSDMYISGGLDKFFTPLSDLWKFSSRTEKWSRIDVEGMLPRYGHTSHVLGNKLIMVGGVNTYDELQPGVGVIDLTTNVCAEFKLPDLSPEKPIALINHTSTLYRDKGIIRTFGGGGNFFSFGTFFNNFSVEIPLHQF